MFVFAGEGEKTGLGGAGWVFGRWCDAFVCVVTDILYFQPEGRKLTEEEEQQMKELFDEYDTDGSGEISRDELYEIVERVIGSHTSSMHIVDVSTSSLGRPIFIHVHWQSSPSTWKTLVAQSQYPSKNLWNYRDFVISYFKNTWKNGMKPGKKGRP